jgi:hypothetical protein
MALPEAVGSLRALVRWLPRRANAWAVGQAEIGDAQRLADAERAAGEVPDGCAWLDDRTIEDVDLPLVFRALDRTATPTGAQALWRWLAAPAVRLEVLAARERGLARLAGAPALRTRLRAALTGAPASDAPHLPRLLWGTSAPPVRTAAYAALVGALVILGALALWWPPLVLGCLGLFVANVVIDDRAMLQLAAQGYALSVLRRVLSSAERVVAIVPWPDTGIAGDVAALAGLRRQLGWLTVSDPFGLADLVRSGFLVRLLLLGRWARVVDRERARLRRVVLWLGELDALVSIASLRAERGDARLPQLAPDTGCIVAGELVHPAIPGAVGNDLALDAGLLVTGSNMSGKSTFLRTVALNAICAQSIHITFGTWRAGLFRVFTVMRVSDAVADGMSTYAVEVAAIGALIDASDRRDHGLPALLVIDEPFRGTNPASRIPIVVAVLDYLGARDTVIAATHDLDVAAGVDPRFARGYFGAGEDETSTFDRKLHLGVSPATNALALLVRAGYPAAIVAAAQRRAPAAPAISDRRRS